MDRIDCLKRNWNHENRGWNEEIGPSGNKTEILYQYMRCSKFEYP